jgi:hypothetical protein
MFRLVYYLVIGLLLSLLSSSFVSCKKEAKCDCSADTIRVAKIFQPDGTIGKDAYVESILPNQNSGNSTILSSFAWTNSGLFDTARVLIEFNLSVVPSLTRIKAAKLSLYWASYGNLTDLTGENGFSIYRITQEWDENTVTWNNKPSVSDLHKVIVPKSSNTTQSYIDIDVTALVQDIIDNPQISHGFMLNLNTEYPYRLVVMASSDNATAAKRPKLVVYY